MRSSSDQVKEAVAEGQAAEAPARSVYHFYGYDPRGSRHYDRLIRSAIETQSGATKPFPVTKVTRASDDQFTRFHVAARGDGAGVSTTVSIMRWERFVAETMIRSNARMVLNGYALVLRGLVTGVVANLFRMNWRFTGILLGLFLIPLGVSLLAAVILVALADTLPIIALVLGCLAITVVAHLGYWAFMMTRMYPRFFFWGMSFYSSMGGLSRRIDAFLPTFDAILDRAVVAIAAEMKRHPGREFVLIGHSAGAILAIEVAGRLIERHGTDGLPTRLRLVTLGGAWAFFAAHTGSRADRHRDHAAALSASPLVEWVDVVAWQDVLSVPDSVNRMPRILRRPPPEFRKFWFVSPQYDRILGRWFMRRRILNFVAMHFYYLLPPNFPGRYNYLNFIYSPWGEAATGFVRPDD